MVPFTISTRTMPGVMLGTEIKAYTFENKLRCFDCSRNAVADMATNRLVQTSMK